MKEEKIFITLPTGEKMGMKIPCTHPVSKTSTERIENIEDIEGIKNIEGIETYIIENCKFHITISKIKENISKGLYPSTKIKGVSPQHNIVNDASTWDGTITDWVNELNKDNAINQSKREDRLKSITLAQKALDKLTKEEWENMNKVFMIKRQFIF